MKIIGDLSSFALEIEEQEVDNSNLREVNIFVGKRNICFEDNLVYVPSFLNCIVTSANYLKRKIDYIKFENNFLGLSVIEAHEFIKNTRNKNSSDYQLVGGDIYDFHRFIDWGETTDNNISFLIPINGFLYLTCEYCSNVNDKLKENAIYGSKVSPYQLIQTLLEAVDELN